MLDPSFLQSVNVDILPSSSGTYSLGSDSLKWKNVYADFLYATEFVGCRGEFKVGGTSDKFYPVSFRIKEYTSHPASLIIFRDSVHLDGSWKGSFYFYLTFTPHNWGHIPGTGWDKIVYVTGSGSPYNDPVGDIADGSTRSGYRELIVWLRGGATYRWYSLGPVCWEAYFTNPDGTSYTDSSGITRDPITEQSDTIKRAKNRVYFKTLGITTDKEFYSDHNNTVKIHLYETGYGKYSPIIRITTWSGHPNRYDYDIKGYNSQLRIYVNGELQYYFTYDGYAYAKNGWHSWSPPLPTLAETRRDPESVYREIKKIASIPSCDESRIKITDSLKQYLIKKLKLEGADEKTIEDEIKLYIKNKAFAKDISKTALLNARLVVILYEKVKQLEKENAELKQRIAELEAKLS